MDVRIGSGHVGLILIAHGSRDARWAEPFERLASKIAQAQPSLQVRLSFMELMSPSVAEASAELVERGCRALRLVPVFLGQGGHVRNDVSRLVGSVSDRYPGVTMELRPPIGEDDAVLDCIAAVSLADLK